MAARFAPADIGADVSPLPENERQALAKLIAAARIIDALFLRQVWAGNEALLLQLRRTTTSAPARPRRASTTSCSTRARGRGSTTTRRSSPACRHKPEAANFYPAGATKADVEEWLDVAARRRQGARPPASSPPSAAAPTDASSPCPTPIEYQGELARAAAHLREAAAAHHAADAEELPRPAAPTRFLTNDYYASDVAWMELDASIEPTIGPYEVYEDEWFAYKAAFEAFITLRDDAETAKLTKFSAQLQGLENALPIDPALSQPEARRPVPHPRRQRRLHRRRRQPRRADRGLQPAQRRARRHARRAPSG